jgi:hypothetical protein
LCAEFSETVPDRSLVERTQSNKSARHEVRLVFDPVQRFRERQPLKQNTPLAGVSVPKEVEKVPADEVQSRKRGVEFRWVYISVASSLAGHEPVFVAVPFATNGDGTIEAIRTDLREKTRPQYFSHEPLARVGDGQLLGRRRFVPGSAGNIDPTTSRHARPLDLMISLGPTARGRNSIRT